MTQSKHIIILVLMLSIFGLKAKAQSTLQSPYEGATHTYTVNGISDGAGFEFFISSNVDGTGIIPNDGATGEFLILNSSGTVGADGLASTAIEWGTGIDSEVYYLWLEVTAPGVGGCSNNIKLRITPQANQFDILADNEPTGNDSSCPETFTFDTFNPTSGAYVAGKSELIFKVERKNGDQDWSFNPLLEVAPDLGLENLVIKVEGTNSGIVNKEDGRYTIDKLDDHVLVTVSIENSPGDERAVTLKITDQMESNTNLSDDTPGNDFATHTIKVMPVINEMGGV